MTDHPELESLYQEARAALKARNYDRASGLLRQILVVDENFKDTSRLLAQAVKLRRRRWYSQPWLWGGLGLIVLVALGIWLAPRLPALVAQSVPTSTNVLFNTATHAPTRYVTRTPSPTLTPTRVPLTWKRIYIGQDFPKDNITAIVIDPKDTDILYVGTDNAGVYKSIDGGLSWQPILNGLGSTRVHSLVMDPADPDILYAGLIFDGVYKTTDGGTSWRAANNGIDNPIGGWEWISRVAMDPQNGQHLFYTYGWGIYETTNGGVTWQVGDAACPSEGISNLVIHPGDSNIVFAAEYDDQGSCKKGIYQSSDGGKNWVLIQGVGEIWFGDLIANNENGYTIDTHRYGCAVLANAPAPNPVLYCGKENALLRSKNNGITWEKLTDGLGNAFFEILPDPDDPDLLYGQSRKSADGGFVLYRSTDKGLTWNNFTSVDCNLDIGANGTLYCWGWNTLLRSNNGKSIWDNINNLPPNTQAVSVNPFKAGEILAQAQSGVGIDGEIYLSLNDGGTWQKTSGDTSYIHNARFYYFTGQNDRIFAVANQGSIYRSMDNGLSWLNCSIVDGWFSKSDSRFALDPKNASRLFIASQGRGVLLSSNDCLTWKESNSGLKNLFVNSLAIDPKDTDIVYAGTNGGAYVSFNGGQDWNEINDGLLGATVVYSIVVNQDGSVYAATPYGIFILEGQ